MGLTFWKRGILVLLFFSLALNIGFVVTTIGQKINPRHHRSPDKAGPLMKILDRMDLPEELKPEVEQALIRIQRERGKFFGRLFIEDKKLLDIVSGPGEPDMNMLASQIESYTRISKEMVLKKVESIIEIRNLLGREKSLYFFSEIEKELRKRRPFKKGLDDKI